MWVNVLEQSLYSQYFCLSLYSKNHPVKPSTLYHILVGKRTASILFKAHTYHLINYFSVFPRLQREQYDKMIRSFIVNEWINAEKTGEDFYLSEQGQKEAEEFFDYVIFNVENNFYEKEVKINSLATLTNAEVIECTDKKTGDIVIVTDCDDSDETLKNMIARFRAKCTKNTRIVNIKDYPFKGGCLGCFNCAVSGECVYKDGFSEILRNDLQKADAIIYAFTIKDHSMGHLFKMYDDRQFCNGHRSVTMGMPVGYLVNGYYSEEENLRMIIEGRSQVGGNFLCGVATNEYDTDTQIDKLAETLEYAISGKLTMPSNFLGVGGMKIFRDLVYQMRGMMKADHKFYKEHNQYDFPQKQWPRMLAMYLVGGMLSSDKIKSKMGNAMNDGMLMPYNKLFEQMDKK